MMGADTKHLRRSSKAFWHAVVQSNGAFFFSVRRWSGLAINAQLLINRL